MFDLTINRIKQHKFNTPKEAKIFQKKMKEMYGYTPKILVFEPRFSIGKFVKPTKKYIIVEPEGLEKI
jgi:hypothetical protein